MEGRRYPHPGCFGGKSAEVTVNKEAEFWRVPKSAQATGSKGDIRNKGEEEVKSSKLKVECRRKTKEGS